eukprot:scaffold245_cov256-Pinguiococcus_pyrenoidosus.AAC.38
MIAEGPSAGVRRRVARVAAPAPAFASPHTLLSPTLDGRPGKGVSSEASGSRGEDSNCSCTIPLRNAAGMDASSLVSSPESSERSVLQRLVARLIDVAVGVGSRLVVVDEVPAPGPASKRERASQRAGAQAVPRERPKLLLGLPPEPRLIEHAGVGRHQARPDGRKTSLPDGVGAATRDDRAELGRDLRRCLRIDGQSGAVHARKTFARWLSRLGLRRFPSRARSLKGSGLCPPAQRRRLGPGGEEVFLSESPRRRREEIRVEGDAWRPWRLVLHHVSTGKR